MHAFIEPPSPAETFLGIIRAGPECRRHGDPYDASAVLVLRDGIPIIKALTASRFSREHIRAATETVRLFTGKTPIWERIKGDRTMARLPHPDSAKNPDGSYDLAKVEADIQTIVDEVKNGNLAVVGMTQHTTKSGRVHFTFEGQLKNAGA